MYILGINISHHGAVCLIKDGEIVFFLEEERLSKIKHHDISYILENNRNSNLKSSLDNEIKLKSISKISRYTKKIDHVIFASYGNTCDSFVMNVLIEQLQENFQIGKTYYYQEHHLYHACSAFYNSGFDRALAIVLDGGGWHFLNRYELKFYEQESSYVFDYENIIKVFKHLSHFGYSETSKDGPDFVYEKDGDFFSNTMSCGALFNVISRVVGFSGSEAGKTMGLAAYGKAENVPETWFKKDDNTGLWTTDSKEFSKSLGQRLSLPEYLPMLVNRSPEISQTVGADLAMKTQIETRDHTIRLIDKFTKLTGEKNVVLSGGYFLNCSNNYEYLKRFPDLNFFVDPVAHDGGTAIGAAKYLWHLLTGDKTIRPLKTLYLGE
jgi:carbamoyltransferase